MTTATEKACTKCGEVRPLSEFHRRAASRTGYTAQCKTCTAEYKRAYREANRDQVLARAKVYREANRDRALAYSRAWREANRDQMREYHATVVRERNLQRKYGLSQADYDRMLADQGGVCAICEAEPDASNAVPGNRLLHVDHDHETGRVRGLLCHACNKALGLIGDAYLDAAADYLRRTRDIDLRGMSASPAPIPSQVNSKRNPIHQRDRDLRRKYGVDLVRYEQLLQRCGGRCEICTDEPDPTHEFAGYRVLAVDHCHDSGRVRGLLCSPCNRSIGLIGDRYMDAAAAYIERHSPQDLEVAA